MPGSPMTRRSGRALTWLVLIGMFVQLAVIVYVGINAHQATTSLRASQRRGCERGKLDRSDNADFQRAHAAYIRKVIIATSVQKDVKDAATAALQTYDRTSADLTQRSKINCKKAFP